MKSKTELNNELTREYIHLSPQMFQAFFSAMIAQAEKDAHTDKNGDVEFVKTHIAKETISDPEVISMLMQMFHMAWPQVRDYVTYIKRRKRSADRKLERQIGKS